MQRKNKNSGGNAIKTLADYIEKSVTPYHTVSAVKESLKKNGYTELAMNEEWKELECGKGYYTEVFGSACVAFYVGSRFKLKGGFLKVITAHTDFPCLRIKTSPERKNSDGSVSLNTEIYGGPILNTWLDRPLSAAGRVMLKGDSIFSPKSVLINFKKSIAVIPNLAIHMNREINKGVELNRQIDMMPYLGAQPQDSADYLIAASVANELNVKKEDILSFDLYVYNNDKPEICGLGDDLFSAPRIDNISSVSAGITALLDAAHDESELHVFAAWDNEEVGSRTKQGGDSQTFAYILEKIYTSLGASRRDYINAVCGTSNAVALSADVAHAQHPNHPEKSDITNKVSLNRGVVFKLSGNQKYATDAEVLAVARRLCEENGIPFQIFANRSDNPGGSTIGSLMSANLPIPTIDIGIPMLAMHSARELSGVLDQDAIYRLMKVFFETGR